MKYSMQEKEGRYTLPTGDATGDWIVKTPFTKRKFVPLNEYTAMSLAGMAGVDIPEIRLVEMDKLDIDNLLPINLADEKLAFAIKRFDRDAGKRIHTESFHSILLGHQKEKPLARSCEHIGKIIYDYCGDGLADAQQYARRLLVNILLANRDWNLKNWCVVYADKMTPHLSPAYDITTTLVYTEYKTTFAIKLGNNNQWYAATMAHFQRWAEQSGIPWHSIKPHLHDTMEKARTLWPGALPSLPMSDEHKESLTTHWRTLHPDFQINGCR